MNKLFEQNLDKLGITLSESQRNQFDAYYKLLIEWNKVMNLTGITEYQEVNLKHFIDSLSLVRVCDMKSHIKVIDIGTGAGFPGIPLKIAFPDLEITLLDSLGKRIKFLDTVISELGLTGVETIHGRAEDFSKDKKYREQYDVCVSRAVSRLATLSEYCLPYIRVGGIFISYKSGEIDEEIENSISALNILGGKVNEVDRFEISGTDIKRSFVKIEKIGSTPEKYPRKAGVPDKKPL